MEIQNKEQFVSEVTAMLRSKEYKDFIDSLTKEEAQLREGVFMAYFQDDFYENQVFNEKNATVAMMKAILSIKDRAENLSAGKYLIEYCNEALEQGAKQIKEGLGGLNTGLTMSVYTNTDLQIKKADTLKEAINWYDRKIEDCKNAKEAQSTLEDVKEE